MKWFDKLHPIAQIALVTIGVALIIKGVKVYGPKIPVVGPMLVSVANFIA